MAIWLRVLQVIIKQHYWTSRLERSFILEKPQIKVTSYHLKLKIDPYLIVRTCFVCLLHLRKNQANNHLRRKENTRDQEEKNYHRENYIHDVLFFLIYQNFGLHFSNLKRKKIGGRKNRVLVQEKIKLITC